jgi:hypothetical protein
VWEGEGEGEGKEEAGVEMSRSMGVGREDWMSPRQGWHAGEGGTVEVGEDGWLDWIGGFAQSSTARRLLCFECAVVGSLGADSRGVGQRRRLVPVQRERCCSY